ncbi:MAG: hypothetical protein QXT28_10335 [Thermofilaceae archaeon]
MDVELVVDSGFAFTVLPARLLRSLGVKPVRRVKLRLADGSVWGKWASRLKDAASRPPPWNSGARACTCLAR